MTFEQLVDTYQHRIFGFALNLRGNPADAEEIAQEAFLRAHKALTGWDAERPQELQASACLHRIALNASRHRLAAQRPSPPPEPAPAPSRDRPAATSARCAR